MICNLLKQTLITLALLSFAQSSFSKEKEDCSSFRLDAKGSSFEKIPLYNQEKISGEDLNICYAITTAELIDADNYSRNQNTNQTTSPLSIHAFYQQTDSPNTAPDKYFQKGGIVNKALASVNNQMLCNQNALEKFLSIYDTNTDSSTITQNEQDSVVLFYKKINTEIENFKKMQTELDANIKTLQQDQNEIDCPKNPDTLKKNSNLLDIGQAISFAAKESQFPKQILTFLDNFCRENNFKVQFKDPIIYNGWLDVNGIQEKEYGNILLNRERKLNELWKDPKKRIPVAIGYDPDFLLGKTAPAGFPHHASALIGRRQNGATCEVLIRNSYGVNCEGPNYRSQLAYPCDNGSIWVPMKKLMEYTTNLTWIPAS